MRRAGGAGVLCGVAMAAAIPTVQSRIADAPGSALAVHDMLGRRPAGWSAHRMDGYIVVEGPAAGRKMLVRLHLLGKDGRSVRGETAVVDSSTPVRVIAADSSAVTNVRFGLYPAQ